MLKFQERSNSWNMMMLAPFKTAKEHAKRKELGFRDGLENFGTPIIMTYVPLVLLTLLLYGQLEFVSVLAALFGLALAVLLIFISSFAFTALAFGVAKLLGGKEKIGRLYYMVSLASAPTFVFTIVINIATLILRKFLEDIYPSVAAAGALQIIGNLVAIGVTFYGLYLLTVAINALYKFGSAKSLAVWLAPAALLLSIGALFFGEIFMQAVRSLIRIL